MTSAGLISLNSRYAPAATMDRMAAAIEARGMSVLARIDHAAAAAKVGLALRPTELLIFGNPRVGTLLMQTTQTIGIDLPLKALVWQDENGQTWLSYNDPAYLAHRHRIQGASQTIAAMSAALAEIAAEVAGNVE